MYQFFRKHKAIFIFIFIIAVALLLFSRLSTHVQVDQINMLETSIIEIQEYSSSLGLDLALTKDKKYKSFWVSDDGYGVLVPIHLRLLSHLTNDDADTELDEKLKDLTRKTIRILKNASYEIDELNTSKTHGDFKYASLTTALRSSDGTLFCSISRGNEFPVWSLTCMTRAELLAAYDAQLPFLQALNIGKFSGKAIDYSQSDNYARVGISDGWSGYYAILKKDNTDWVVVFEGQDTPSCESMKKNNIPASIYEQCY
jgi:hypothetical protein